MFNRTKNLYGRLIVIAALGLMLVASSAAFADEYETNAQGTVLPYRGMYYEHGHGGTGLTVDVDKNGYVFAVFYAYDAGGNPYYYLMEGFYKPNDPNTILATGVIGTLDADAYISENGECVGTGCTYRGPDRSDAHLPAHLTWTDPRSLHIKLGSQSWDITAGSYTLTDGELISGDWLLTRTSYDPDFKSYTFVYSTHVSKTDMTASQFRGCEGGYVESPMVLPDDAVIYVSNISDGRTTYYYFSADTNTSGGFRAKKCFPSGFGKPDGGGTNLFITGPNDFRYYAQVLYEETNPKVRGIFDYRLIRLPPGSELYIAK